jgi:hypothetical protein
LRERNVSPLFGSTSVGGGDEITEVISLEGISELKRLGDVCGSVDWSPATNVNVSKVTSKIGIPELSGERGGERRERDAILGGGSRTKTSVEVDGDGVGVIAGEGGGAGVDGGEEIGDEEVTE